MSIENQLNVIVTFANDNLVPVAHVEVNERLQRVYVFTGTGGEYMTAASIMHVGCGEVNESTWN